MLLNSISINQYGKETKQSLRPFAVGMGWGT